ncbi:hypothetical protein M2440_000099 [Methylorubrum extorquens]|nr:hypothetical protein [Methylorubrum extorquens]
MPPPFDYDQPFVIDTSKIRQDLGYTDLLDEPAAMNQIASQASASSVP